MTDKPTTREEVVGWLARWDWGEGIELSPGDFTKWRQFLDALEQAGLCILPREPTEEMGKASAIVSDLPDGGRLTQWGVNVWDKMLAASPFTEQSDDG